MAEYIDREAAKKFLAQDYAYAAAELLDYLPAADVVEVVRCRECEYWQDNNGGYPRPECSWRKDETPDADDFCSYGERKGGGSDA